MYKHLCAFFGAEIFVEWPSSQLPKLTSNSCLLCGVRSRLSSRFQVTSWSHILVFLIGVTNSSSHSFPRYEIFQAADNLSSDYFSSSCIQQSHDFSSSRIQGPDLYTSSSHMICQATIFMRDVSRGLGGPGFVVRSFCSSSDDFSSSCISAVAGFFKQSHLEDQLFTLQAVT